MYSEVAIIVGFSIAAAGLSLAFLSQRYWFARVWRFAGRMHDQAWRKAIRGTLLLLLLVVGLAALADIVRNIRGTISHGSWWSAFFGWWLFSSIISYLFIKIIIGTDWLWRGMRSMFIAKPSTDLVPSSVNDLPDVTKTSARMDNINHSRRRFFHAAGIFAGAVPFVSAGYGFLEERFRFQVREVEISVANLPTSLEGMRITQMSDIHIGAYMPVREVRRAVDMANELRGDLTVVTGDFVTTRTDPLEDCIAQLSRLHAPLGVWGCNGNHEIYAGVEEKAATLFHQYGMKLLRQENAELRWKGSPFNLIGVDYQRERGKDGIAFTMLSGLAPLIRRDVPNILLSHNPNSFPRAAELGIELSLAGHTHGGQVRVEILHHGWNPARFFTPYVAGPFSRPLYLPSSVTERDLAASLSSGPQPASSSVLYVNRGLGTIGAPVRLGVPPEITLMTLRCA